MVNKGKFEVLKRDNKYSIVYIEKGESLDLGQIDSKYCFDNYEVAKKYITDNETNLDACVTKIIDDKKKAIEKRIADEEAKKKAQEEKWIAEGKRKAKKEAEKARKKKERKEKRRKRLNKMKGWLAGFLTAAILLVGGHYLWAGISSLFGRDDETEDVSNDTSLEESNVSDDLSNDNSYGNDIDNIIGQDEELTVENFTNLVAEFSKIYLDNNVNVTTEDLTKFVSILNIDKLTEENPEFAKELFGTQGKEEYVGDAAKIIGMTYTYNRNVFEKEQSTENFIRISNGVIGPQKELLQVVEGYVDQIALVRDNAEEVNKLIAELLQKLGDPTSELSYLDDGTGFGMQVCIELIRSYLAKDVISKENKDMLTVLTSSEEYVSNIFVTYDGCVVVYTRTRTK